MACLRCMYLYSPCLAVYPLLRIHWVSLTAVEVAHRSDFALVAITGLCIQGAFTPRYVTSRNIDNSSLHHVHEACFLKLKPLFTKNSDPTSDHTKGFGTSFSSTSQVSSTGTLQGNKR